jgi:hypothetical protein
MADVSGAIPVGIDASVDVAADKVDPQKRLGPRCVRPGVGSIGAEVEMEAFFVHR